MSRIKNWLHRNRTSVRVAFVLQMCSMLAGVGLSLGWSRWLLRAMGDELNGLFLTFQGVTRLGGLGDLGMGGAVALRAGQLLGERDERGLRSFLAQARGLFALLGLSSLGVVLVCSPWLPGWLQFATVPGAGSLTTLFLVGAAGVGTLIFSSYFFNLNYAHGTVTWPVLPSFLLGQLALVGHWRLAVNHAPLWLQYLPYLAAALAMLVLSKKLLDWSHPWLGEVTPWRCEGKAWRPLLASSGWVYLCGLGSAIYVTTDRLVLNAGFGPALIPKYFYNYKLCELATTVVLTISAVSLPKITQWLASPQADEQARARSEIVRLNQLQVVLGSGAAMGYLAVNGWFIRWWLGENYAVPLGWQLAFALNLATTTGGSLAVQVAGRCGANGLRRAGQLIGLTGVVNLGLAVWAMKLGSVVGVASAAVVAQSFLNVALGVYVCRYLDLAVMRWLTR
ncbi:MAG: hypothetical protein RL380_1060, partial [Verrucomicrobiota bacterium]